MITVTTVEGERWDTLSHRVFGSADRYRELWAHNPESTLSLRYASTLPAGLTLAVPTTPAQTIVEATPPWRR